MGDTLGNRSPAAVRTMETGTQRRGTRSASRFVVCLALLIHHRAIVAIVKEATWVCLKIGYIPNEIAI